MAGFFDVLCLFLLCSRFISEGFLPAVYSTFLNFQELNVEDFRTSQESGMLRFMRVQAARDRGNDQQ